MGSIDRIDDLTLSANFTGNGVEKLRDQVNEKLKEFMGDYTDDALVEYVIVLLKNGRRKEEAKNELNVFLGDDSDSFVSWLWDHLATNISLYVQSEEPCPDMVVKAKPSPAEKLERNNSSRKRNSESDRGEPNPESKIRHNREWKGLVRDASDPPPLLSSEIETNHVDKRSRQRVRRTRRSPSPRRVDKKRSRIEEQLESERETTQVSTGASRRLLQFAVRDAVSMPKSSNTTTEPSPKHLRSVVSMPTKDSSVVEHPQRIKSVARVPNAMATVIKAVAEAAEDSVRAKSSGSVFDRLGRGMNLSRPHIESASYEETIEDSQYRDDKKLHRQKPSTYLQRRVHSGAHGGDMTDAEFGSNSTSENEGYDDVNVVHRSGTETYGGNRDENSVMMDYSVDKNAGNSTRMKRSVHQDQPAIASNTSQKIVNISVNVNTYQGPREAKETEASKSGIRINGSTKAAADSQQEPQKTVLPRTGNVAGRPVEDVDSRTLFVSNVHFGATKDGLSRHFNKFGEVLKVVIVTDVATRQPTGSAYVEFMRKDAADSALSLDGTSFMSRLLKVVRRSGAQQETANTMGWASSTSSRATRSGRFPRRGMTRSFQWKRDANPVPVPVPVTCRSLTYVRKPEANQS